MSDREKNIIETLREGNRELRAECNALQTELQSVNESRKKVCKALSDLYDACMQADGEGELYYTIDGDLLDAARQAIKQVEG